MYRTNLIRRCVTQVSLTSFSKNLHSTGKAHVSILFRKLYSREKLRLTYSQWHYLREVFDRNKQFDGPVSSQWKQAAALTTSTRCESVDDVFENYHTLLQKDRLSPDTIVQFTTSLRTAVYSSLGQLPWLHNDNHVIAFMQILMNGRMEDLLMRPLYDQRHFQSIYDHIDHHVDEIPKKDCPSILLSLIYSGLDKHDPLISKLLSQCHEAAPHSDIHQIRDLTYILQSLGGRNFALAERIVSRLDEIFSNGVEDVDFEIKDMCASSPILAVFMSDKLLEKCTVAVLRKLQSKSPHLDIFTIGCCFRYARKMKFRISSELLTQIKLLGKAALDNLEDFSHLQSYHIAEICHNGKNLGCFSGAVVDKVQARSLQLLRSPQGNLRLRDITNLLFAFSRDASPSLKQEVSLLLVEHLDDADVLTLSNIADNILDMALYDHELVTSFQHKVMQNIDSISQYITRLVKVLRLLRDRRDYDTRFNQQLCASLLKHLDRRYGYDPTLVVVASQFILPNVRTVVPALLMESLTFGIARCNLSLMLMILNTLEKMKGPKSRSLYKQLLEIRSNVQQHIGHQVKNAVHAGQLADVIKGVHIKSRVRDFVLLDDIMEQYSTLTKSMSRTDYLKTLHVFKRLPHPAYQPQIFEDLVSFTKNNYSQFNISVILDLVNILGNAGYRPENFDDFSAFVTEILEETMEDEDHFTQISLAHYLSLMHIFPDNVLGQIFTFDYLEQIDSIIDEKGEPGEHEHFRNLMMQLNRSVFLECPHLDVPWFHEDYCQKMIDTSHSKGFRRHSALVEEVKEALEEAVAGEEFVGHNVHSPYFHPIDFEIVLDASGKPVTHAAVQLLNPEELDYQKVAVMLITNQQLCSNSVRRRGQQLRDRRQLEILGYRVEEICRYDWHSMALSDWGAKVDFVRSKIFRSSNNAAPMLDSVSKSTERQL